MNLDFSNFLFFYLYIYYRKNRNLVIPIVLTNIFYIEYSTKTDRKF